MKIWIWNWLWQKCPVRFLVSNVDVRRAWCGTLVSQVVALSLKWCISITAFQLHVRYRIFMKHYNFYIPRRCVHNAVRLGKGSVIARASILQGPVSLPLRPLLAVTSSPFVQRALLSRQLQCFTSSTVSVWNQETKAAIETILCVIHYGIASFSIGDFRFQVDIWIPNLRSSKDVQFFSFLLVGRLKLGSMRRSWRLTVPANTWWRSA